MLLVLEDVEGDNVVESSIEIDKLFWKAAESEVMCSFTVATNAGTNLEEFSVAVGDSHDEEGNAIIGRNCTVWTDGVVNASHE